MTVEERKQRFPVTVHREKDGLTFYVCPKGHKFGLPMTIGKVRNFIIFSRFEEGTACPVCWFGEDWNFKEKGFDVSKPAKVLTVLGLKYDEIDWEHRGQHFGCQFCQYELKRRAKS